MKMNTKVLALAAVIAGVLTMGAPLFAHHGDAAYDESKPVILKDAVVTEYAWMNPHTLIKADAKDDKGKVQHWTVEIGSTPSMTLLGWSRGRFGRFLPGVAGKALISNDVEAVRRVPG